MTQNPDSTQLPPSWLWMTLGEIGIVKAGGTPSTNNSDNFGGEIAWITPADLTGYKKKFIGKGRKSLSEQGLKSSSAVLLPKGTVLFSSRAPIGYVAIAENPVSTNQGFKNLIPFDFVFNEYVFYYLKGSKKLAESFGSGTTFKEVSASRFQNIPIPICPIPEQRRIVGKVEELFSFLDAGIESLRKVQAQLRRYRQAVLKYAFAGKLTEEWRKNHKDKVEPAQKLLERIKQERHFYWKENIEKLDRDPRKYRYNDPITANHEKLPLLPDEWVYASADELSIQITDGEHITPARQETGIYLLSARNILDGRLTLDDVDFISNKEYERIKKRLNPEVGDVLLSCSGSVGRTCVVPIGQFSMVRSVAIIKPIKKFVSGEYMSFALRSFILQSQINRKKTQTAQANIFQGKIRTLAFPLASLAEQLQIVKEIDFVFHR